MTNPPPVRVLPRAPRPGSRRKPLLCLPYAGGGSRSYEGWQRLLPQSVDAQTLRLPGREARMDEPLPSDLRGLAAEIADELGPHLTGPFALFGHSMGALVAHELALQLRSSFDVEPDCLFVSGSRPPHRLDRGTGYSHLDDATLRAAIEHMGGTDPEVLADHDLWELFRPIIRSDLALCDAYEHRPAEPLSCPVVAYGSKDDGDLDEESLDAWRTVTTGTFASRMFPGDHFYFQRWPEAFAMDLINRLYQHVLEVSR
ncbi:thioesterase II family protein [Kitasatospora sp. NPDC056138]|uniref:thioesterase II family protein n=1 Tax=Kitasatospora sp. NPDC056138 TaxID=3345724 RepID=UPI0035D786FC